MKKKVLKTVLGAAVALTIVGCVGVFAAPESSAGASETSSATSVPVSTTDSVDTYTEGASTIVEENEFESVASTTQTETTTERRNESKPAAAKSTATTNKKVSGTTTPSQSGNKSRKAEVETSASVGTTAPTVHIEDEENSMTKVYAVVKTNNGRFDVLGVYETPSAAFDASLNYEDSSVVAVNIPAGENQEAAVQAALADIEV